MQQSPSPVQVYRDSHRLFGHEKVVSILSNNQSQVAALETSLQKATTMLDEGAYLHHFDKFGVTKDQFLEAFMTCEELLAHYKQLT
jgi:hypothetical protein